MWRGHELFWEVMPKLADFIPVTLLLFLAPTAISLVFGAWICKVRVGKKNFAYRVVSLFVSFFRGTPGLVQLYLVYFGLPKLGLSISAELCGALGLGLLGGSYMTESFRSGLEAVPKSQSEGAYALNMSKGQLFKYIILPEAFTLSVPAVVANVIFLLKETSVFSAISLMDLMFTAKDLIGLYYKTTECLVLLVIFYIIMLLPVSFLGSRLEKRVRFSMFGD